MVNPDGKYAKYNYDVLGNLISLQTSASKTDYTYDVLNRLDTVKDGARLLADYDYDAVGNLVQTKLADGSTETRGYDVRDRVTNITTKNSVGYVFSGYTYTLDATGNRLKMVESNGRTVDYQYDVLNRLTSEQITDVVHGNQSFGYTYDAAGNRLTKNNLLLGVTNYIYDNNNRLTSTQLGSEVTNFTYDLNGSMTSRSNGTQTVTYSCVNDGENRLVGLFDGTTTSQFVYDGMGDRVATITNGIRTNYLTAGSLPQVVLEYDANGLINADYTQGLGLIRKRDGSREGFYHTDALGSTRLITDNVGLILDRYNYDAFGVALNQTNTFANSFQFAGEQRDGTGLDYLRARYYDASLGRFISKDPFGGTTTDPYSQNSYQYAQGNPVIYTDPTGYYFSMAGVTAALNIAGTLAVLGGSTFGLGYIAGAAAKGEEVWPMFGEWGAGFANGVSGGFLIDVYEAGSRTKIVPKHAMLYQAGNVAGIGVGLLTGLRAATWARTQLGPLKWVASAQFGLDVYGAAKATGNLYNSYQDNGKWEQEDVWNLLAYIPFIGAVVGAKKFFSFGKAASADNAVGAAAGNTLTKAGNCFVAGTEIQTIDGEKNIEDIQVGDWVLADDPNTPGEVEYKQVLDTFVRHTDKLVDLFIDGEVISTTDEHPFWTPDKGWVEAKDLVVGSLVMTEDGRVIDVDGMGSRTGDFTVYNFKVDGFHSYFVSDLGVLVHNAEYPLTKNDLGIHGDIEQLIGTFSVQDRVATVKIGMIKGEINNPFELLKNLQNKAREAGANTLRIEAVIANEQLYNVLIKRYGMKTGAIDIIEIPLN